MARLPLEDNFTDVIAKAQRGLKISDAQLAERAEVSMEDLAAVKSGRLLDAVIRRVARHLKVSASALEDLAHKRHYPTAPVFPRGLAMFNTPYGDGLTVNNYLVWDARSRFAAVFDTGVNAEALIATIEAEELDVRHIFITHTHEDHIAALPALASACPRAEVWSGEREPVDHPGAKTFAENAHFHVGEIAIKTLFTWGHSPGMTTYFITGLSWPVAIVGDSLFSCSIGGSATHYAEQLRNDNDKIFTLPRNTVIAPGHGPLTTLAFEKQHNPFFAR